jgi:hypothetical protein
MSNAGKPSNQAMGTLPHLRGIFEALRQGRHLSRADGLLYQSLEDDREVFTSLFDQLGFELKKHRRDFYYFCSPNAMSERSERLAVFMFILIEWITDQGHNIEEALMSQQFSFDELPHLTTQRYCDYMAQLGILDSDGLRTIVTNMIRTGFAERVNDEVFAFRCPVYRFLDICQDIASSQTQNGPGEEGGDHE